ncbi:unnamed protein product, partial [Effrenium voratum]
RRWSDRAPSIPQLEEEAAAEEPAELLEDQVHERVVEEELSQIDAERTEVSRSQLQLPAGWRRRPATTPQFNWSQEAALVNDAPRRGGPSWPREFGRRFSSQLPPTNYLC